MAATEEEMTAANGDGDGEALLRVAVCRELTKAHEQIEVGGAREIERRFADGTIPARGEFVFAAAAKTTAPKSPRQNRARKSAPFCAPNCRRAAPPP